MPRAKLTKSASAYHKRPDGKASFQHWYRDNQIYFLTARCRERYPAFASEQAKNVFWAQFDKYTAQHGFEPWVTSLLDNHWHSVGYLFRGDQLGPMMNGIQGSVAKLVNDFLESQFRAGLIPAPPQGKTRHQTYPGRLTPFWYESRSYSYFDGCLRDEKQGRLTYRYVLTQCRRHKVCDEPADYPHTRVRVPLDQAIARAKELEAFLYGVPYKRYQHPEA